MGRAIPQGLRRLVVERARGRCECCLIHQDDVLFSHQIDHLIAVKHGGSTVGDNLALSCLECNRHKGTDLTTLDPATGSVTLLFNPRKHQWRDHFSVQGARIVGKTAVGRATMALLRFNDAQRLIERRALLAAGRYPPAGMA